MACPDEIMLAALAEGRGGSAQAHLDSCASCREEVLAIQETLASGPEPRDARSVGYWKEVSLGAVAAPSRALPFLSPAMLRAASVLLALGAWAAWARWGASRSPSAPPAAPAQDLRADWLLGPGQSRESEAGMRRFILGGSAVGTLDRSSLAELDPKGETILLRKGALWLGIPEGMKLKVAFPDGASVQAESGALWASLPDPKVAGLLRDAWASPAARIEVWLESGRGILRTPEGRETPLTAPALAVRGPEGWSVRPAAQAPEGATALRDFAAAWKPSNGPWEVRDRTEMSGAGWILDGSAGRARLGTSRAVSSGVLTVPLQRPADGLELTIVFPQPGGARSWPLGSWEARGLGETAVLSVAFGPWGAEGYLNGRRAWTRSPRETASLLQPAEGGLSLGVVLRGGRMKLPSMELREGEGP